MEPNTNKSILQWNCRGFRPNFEEIKNLISNFKPYILALQETHLKDTDNVNIRGFDHYFKTCVSEVDGRATGGCSIFVKKGIPHEVLELDTELQAVAVKVSLHKTITVCNVYIPPRFNVAQSDLDNLVNQLPAPFLFIGDFNAHSDLWGCSSSNSLGNKVEHLLESSNICLLNDKSPTYFHPASGSFTSIDLSLCSASVFLDFAWQVHSDQCGSDHFPILIDIVKSMPKDNVPRWNLKKADWPKFKLQCSLDINRHSFTDITEKFPAFLDKLNDIARQCVPKSTGQSTGSYKPWFNSECKKAVKARQNAMDKCRTNPTSDNINEYKSCRANARKVIKESKRKSWHEYVSKLNVKTPAKKVWEMIRKISGKQSNTTIHHLENNDGTKITERVDIANRLAQEISKNSSSNNYRTKFQKYQENAEKEHLDFDTENSENYNVQFTIRELCDALKKSHDTATGPDEIHYQLLKHLPRDSLMVLLDIFNDIWASAEIPECWKEATVIPIPKPGKDSKNPSNYRPISLTSCLCKTMERMINTRLVWFLEKNNILTKYQSGFRKGRTTTDQLIRLESFIRDSFLKGNHVVSVFFDLEKAYDTVWKYGVIRDLHKVGLRGRMPMFIQNFLSDRVFRVRLGSVYSDIHGQEMGVPQGSILSVTLFILKINSIADVIPASFEKSLFVDDFSITCSSRNMASIERQLQLCLNKVEKWADENGFKFSKTKTVCMHFCNKRKLHPDPTLTIYNSQIPVVSQTKFLGIIFDSKLNFKAHIDYIRQKCEKAMNLLKVVAKMDWGADRSVLMRLYRSFVRSRLEYGCAVFSSARKSYLKKLEPIQNQGLRICLGAFRTSPMQSLYVEANEPPLYLRFDKLSIQYALKLRSNPDNPAYDAVFNPQYYDLYDKKPSAIRSFGHRVEEDLSAVCPQLDLIQTVSLPDDPPWTIQKPHIDLLLTHQKKQLGDDCMFQSLFAELKGYYSDHRAIYTDGSKTENRVAAAATSDGLSAQVRLPGNASIFTAELQALKMAFNIVKNCDWDHFIIFSDSLSSLQALDSNNCDHPFIQDILKLYNDCLSVNKKVVLAWVPSHVGIKGNEKADELAKQALNFNVLDLKVPYTDLRVNVNSVFKQKWQAQWNECPDKLFQINPTVGDFYVWTGLSRREEIVITRARIGHTYFTHSYLLKGEDMPWCIPCHCPDTVKHILLDCIDLRDTRIKYYRDINTMEKLFNENVYNIINYLKECGLFKKF